MSKVYKVVCVWNGEMKTIMFGASSYKDLADNIFFNLGEDVVLVSVMEMTR